MKTGKNGKRNFTLIELLIVVAIIAILAGILMPALSSALRKAKIISCTGNQKSIGLALSMYATDFNELFPSAGSWRAEFPWHYWHRTLLMCGYMGKAFQTENQAYDNDKRGKNVLICPEDTNPFSMGTGAAAKDFLSYGLNAEIASFDTTSKASYHYIPRNRLILGSSCGKSTCNKTIKKSPQDIVIVTDSFQNNTLLPEWNKETIYAYPDSELSSGMISPRHTTGIPVTFVDGHVNFWTFPFSQQVLRFEKEDKY